LSIHKIFFTLTAEEILAKKRKVTKPCLIMKSSSTSNNNGRGGTSKQTPTNQPPPSSMIQKMSHGDLLDFFLSDVGPPPSSVPLQQTNTLPPPIVPTLQKQQTAPSLLSTNSGFNPRAPKQTTLLTTTQTTNTNQSGSFNPRAASNVNTAAQKSESVSTMNNSFEHVSKSTSNLGNTTHFSSLVKATTGNNNFEDSFDSDWSSTPLSKQSTTVISQPTPLKSLSVVENKQQTTNNSATATKVEPISKLELTTNNQKPIIPPPIAPERLEPSLKKEPPLEVNHLQKRVDKPTPIQTTSKSSAVTTQPSKLELITTVIPTSNLRDMKPTGKCNHRCQMPGCICYCSFDHDSKQYEDWRESNGVEFHMCSNPHSCSHNCSHRGFCEIKAEAKYNDVGVKLPCKKEIKPYKLTHEGKCLCFDEEVEKIPRKHFCAKKCPACLSICR